MIDLHKMLYEAPFSVRGLFYGFTYNLAAPRWAKSQLINATAELVHGLHIN